MYRKQLKRHSLAVSSSFLIKSERNANVLSWRIIRNSFIKKTAAPHKWNSLLHFPHDEVLRLSHISVHSSGVGSMGSFYMHERGRQGWEQEYSILLIHQQKIHQSNHRTKKKYMALIRFREICGKSSAALDPAVYEQLLFCSVALNRMSTRSIGFAAAWDSSRIFDSLLTIRSFLSDPIRRQ